MAVKNSYSKARATKKTSSINLKTNINKKDQNKAIKSIKKSPILILALVFLLLGAVGGFFAYKMLSTFELNTFVVNGVASAENDYIVVDLSEIKEDYFQSNSDKTIEDFYASISLKDNTVSCKFFGIDKSDTIVTKYYYREDISHDAVEVNKIDLETAGVYYIEYTSSFFAFKNSTLIRTIIVTEVENDG